MNPSLLDLRSECAAVSAAFRGLAGDLSDAQLAWAPRSEEWSVAQCLDHLVLTAEAYRPRIEEALREARPSERSAELLRLGFFGGWRIG